MLKRTFSFVLVLTMLATCLFILPASAEESTPAFTYIAGGKWVEKEVVSSAELLASTTMPTAGSLAYDKATTTATQTGNEVPKLANLSNLRMNESEDGVVEIMMTVAPTGTWSELYASTVTSSYAQWILRMNPYIDGNMVACGNNWAGLSVTRKDSEANACVEFPRNSTTNYKKYTSGMEIPIKLVIEKKNGVITATNWVDITNTGDWKTDSGVSATYTIPEGANGELTGVGFRFGTNSSPGGTIKWVFSNASVKELAPKTVRLSDLSAEEYVLEDDVTVDFVLPEGMTAATLTVDGTKVADLSGAVAGAYTGTLDLAQIGKTGTFPVVLSGTANGAAFSTSTTLKINRPAFGSLDKNILSDPVAGGDYQDNIAMTGDAFLAASKFADASNTNLTYTRPNVAGGVATLNAKGNTASYSGGDFAGAPNLKWSTIGSKQVIELTVDVKPEDLTCFKGKDGAYVLQFFPYINGTAKRFAYPYDALVFRCNGAGGDGNLTYTWGVAWANRAANVYTAGTVIEYKLVSEIENGTLTATQYARVKGTEEWQVGPTKSFTELTNAVLNGFGMAVNTQSTSALDLTKGITWTLSNAKVVEKAPDMAAITDLSSKTYLGNELVPVSICLPANYKEAVLTAGDTDIATFKGVASGGYAANLSIAGIGKTGRIPLTLSGTTTDGKTFSASTNFYVAAPAAGSLDEELLTDPVASAYFADKVAMDNADALNRTVSGFTYAYDAATQSATVHNGGAWQTKAKLLDFPSLRLNDVESGSLEINMDVEVKPGSGTTFSTASSTSYSLFTLSPIINGTAVDLGIDRYDAGILTYLTNSGSPILSWARQDFTHSVSASGNKVPLKIVVTKDANGITWTQQVKFNDQWLTYNTNNTTYTGSGDLTGMRLWLGQNSTDASNYVAWNLSNVSVVEKAATTAEIRDLSAGFYTQYDTVPVDFNLPTGYKDAMITVDGTPVAVYAAATGDNAGSWQSKLDLKKLGKVGTVKIGLQGTMNGGGEFNKATTLTVKAATAGADSVDWTKATVIDNAALIGTVDATANTRIYSAYNATSNPYGPFLTQYAIEYIADVDFSNVIPIISFEGPNSSYSSGANVLNIQDYFNFPKSAFQLKFIMMNENFEKRDGSTTVMNIIAYADGVCLGSASINCTHSTDLTALRPLTDSDGYARLKFGKPTGYADEVLTVKNFTVNKYSLISAVSAEMVSDNAVSVTLDRAMESSGISLAKADGTPIEAVATVSGKTVTLTAESALPADVKVVFGTGTEEADYTFTGCIKGTSTANLTRLGETITVPFAISANNTAATLQGTDLKVWESGQNAIIKATVNELVGSSAKLIVAAYKDNNGLPKLVESKVETLSATEAGLKDYVFNLQFDNSYDYFKVFLWDATSGINALFDSQNTK